MSSLKICAISDTHQCHAELKIPDADVIVHCGDSCNSGGEKELVSFLEWFAALPHKHKLLTFGNHDRFAFDFPTRTATRCETLGIEVLIQRKITIEGVSFYGSPWTRAFGWTKAFMYDPCDAYAHWKDMPKCDVLITHSPPFGILDSVGNMPLGEQDLMNAVYRTQPQYHVFGHLHDPHGGERYRKWEDGSGTVFANVCRVGENYKPVADPVYTFEV